MNTEIPHHADDTVPVSPSGRYGRWLLWAGIGLTVLAVVAGGYLLWQHVRHQGPPQYQGQALYDAVDKANASGDYRRTVTLLEGQKSQDYQTQKLLAIAYVNAKEYDRALALLAQMDQAKKLNGYDTKMAARVAEEAGKKQLAISYYQSAKDRFQASNVRDLKRQIRECDQKITELQAAQ